MSPRPDPLTAVTEAEQRLAGLLEQRELSLEGKARAPHPAVIAATEVLLEQARAELRKVLS